MKAGDEERFWSRVIGTDYTHCWLWSAARLPSGYGAFRASDKQYRAHRWAWINLMGDIPDELVLDHLCRNKTCVNPWHLEPVSQAENVRRGAKGVLFAPVTECIHGHAFTPENTATFIRKRDGRPVRQCRTCNRERNRARNATIAARSAA